MQDKHKTKKELIQELEGLRRRLAEPEKPVSRDVDRTASWREQELTLRSISNNLLSGMIYQVVRKNDGTRVFTYLSHTVRRFYGITAEEGLANADLIYDRVHKDDRGRVFQEEEEAHRTLSPFRSVVRVVDPRGKIRWSSFVSQPRRLADGSTCWDGIEFDITDRKLAEEALRESEEKLSQIFRTSPDAIAIARTADGVYVDVNESYSQVSGYSREELIGRSPLPGDLNLWVRRKDRDPFAATLKKTGEALGMEIQFRRKDGAIRHALLSARVLDIPGEPCHIAIIRDITEWKEAEKASKESAQRHRIILQTAMDGFCMMNMEGRLLEANEAYCRMSGYSEPELLTMNIADLEIQETQEEIRDHMAQVKSQGEARFETWHRRRDGSLLEVEVSAKYRPSHGGGFEVFLRDISDRKQAEKALQKSKERLRALSAHLQSVREEERANISREIHDDLGQRLTGLKMDLAWLIRHLNPDQLDLKNKVQSLGQSIDQTVQSVRQISTKLRPRILDDFGLIAALEWQAQEFTEKTGVLCRFQSTVQILDLKPDLMIAVFRIFQEALTNVARHAGATRVEASLKTDAQGLVLKIRDNGRGISDQENFPSKSLGLVGMRERAFILGGTIEIQGRKGKGTTVVLRLPIPE